MNVLYAALWEAYRIEYQMSSGGPGSGLFKSTDGGTTWPVQLHMPALPPTVNESDPVVMARDDGRGNPGDETTSFRPGDHKIHCVVKLKEAKAGTGMRFSWWVVDSEGTQNKKIKDIDYTTRARENIVHAHLSLPDEWPTGKYKVQVYVNGDLDRTVAYTVE